MLYWCKKSILRKNTVLAIEKFPFLVLSRNATMLTGGDNSNKRCFGTKPKLFREFGDFCGNRDTWKFFRETRDNSGRLQKKIGTSKEILFDVSPKFGRMIKFPGRLNLRPSIAQTAFVRVVTPRKVALSDFWVMILFNFERLDVDIFIHNRSVLDIMPKYLISICYEHFNSRFLDL